MLSAAYSPAAPDEHRLEATAEALYLMMGRGLERLPVRCALRLLPCSQRCERLAAFALVCHQ